MGAEIFFYIKKRNNAKKSDDLIELCYFCSDIARKLSNILGIPKGYSDSFDDRYSLISNEDIESVINSLNKELEELHEAIECNMNEISEFRNDLVKCDNEYSYNKTLSEIEDINTELSYLREDKECLKRLIVEVEMILQISKSNEGYEIRAEYSY